MPVEAWSPIVYGRTARADSWWRAVPTGLPHQDWLGMLVSAIISGGDRLDQPRFLLARLNGYWVTGVACMAAELSDEFASDGRRRLYTFVGWSAPVDVGGMPPDLDDLRGSYHEWAAPLYREWVGLDWGKHASQAREPHETAPAAPPWPQSAQTGEADGAADLDGTSPAGPRPLSATPGEIELWPAADEERLWEAGLRSRHAFVLTVGWAGVHYVPRSTLTHAAVDGLTAPEQVPAEPGGLDMASAAMPDTEAITQQAPSLARPHLTIGLTAPAVSASVPLRSMKDILLGRTGEDLAPAVIHIQILIVTSDNKVLVVDNGEEITLPHGIVRQQELPSTVCTRIARESLGLEVSQITPLLVAYFVEGSAELIIFHCSLTTDHAEVRPRQGVLVALRPIDDKALPDDIKDMVNRLETGIEDPEYVEYLGKVSD